MDSLTDSRRFAIYGKDWRAAVEPLFRQPQAGWQFSCKPASSYTTGPNAMSRLMPN